MSQELLILAINMELDYSVRIENLRGRRYDEALREPILSESFHHSEYSDCIKYVMESMLEIDPSYAYKVYAHSRKIHEKLHKTLLKRGFKIDYRYQGELKTYSNILLYGDVEIIVIKNNISDKPHIDIQRMAMELMDILRVDSGFRSVDYSDKTRIRITALKPTCEIDILPSVWIDSAEYKKTKNEIYRGIAEFDFKKKKVKKYLPFLNIARFNALDQQMHGSVKAMSRLLKSLKADNHEKIDLKNSEINAILYSIPREDLDVEENKRLSILPRIDAVLHKLSTDYQSFSTLLSPSGKDRVFAGHNEKQEEIGKLRKTFAMLAADLRNELDKINLDLEAPITYDTSMN